MPRGLVLKLHTEENGEGLGIHSVSRWRMTGEKVGGTAIIFQKFPECQIEASSWSRWFFQTTSELSKFSLLSLLLVSETESRVLSLWVKTKSLVPLKSSSNRRSCIYSLVDISVTFPGQMPWWWFDRLSVHLSALPHDFVNPPWHSVEAPMVTIEDMGCWRVDYRLCFVFESTQLTEGNWRCVVGWKRHIIIIIIIITIIIIIVINIIIIINVIILIYSFCLTCTGKPYEKPFPVVDSQYRERKRVGIEMERGRRPWWKRV